MVVGLALAVAGVVALIVGGRLTAASVKGTYGSVDSTTMKAAEGNRVVPTRVSLLVLSGWMLIVAGVVVVIAS
jgi:hypothetical protein